MRSVEKVAALKELLRSMERDIFDSDLSENQKDVIYAASLACDENSEVSPASLQSHALTQHMSRPTFFRTLRTLVDENFLKQVEQGKASRYRLNISSGFDGER